MIFDNVGMEFLKKHLFFCYDVGKKGGITVLQEIQVEKNPLGLRVYIDGVPDLKQLSEDEKDLALSGLQYEIKMFFKKKRSKCVKDDTPDLSPP